MNSAIISKIEKLLRLGQSSNENESTLALLRAKELALKHEIDLATINTNKKEGYYLLKLSQSDEVNTIIKDYIDSIIVTHFRVNLVNHWHGFTMIGKASDLKIASYTYKFLYSEFKRLFKLYLESITPVGRTAYYERSYYHGLYNGLSAKLEKQEKETLSKESQEVNQSWSLMRLSDKDKIDQLMHKIFPNLQSKYFESYQLDHTVTQAGFKDGEKINLNKALDTTNNNQQRKLT